ncbi:MAG: hypothetical protein C4B58_06670 [Deltaproteobacteria bacterium]|nr:MAG: hypothetical protein C4B58_06670 [Deltaproteobacteria bacterium]
MGTDKIKIVGSSELWIKGKEDKPLNIVGKEERPVFIGGREDKPLYIGEVQNISPVAAHIKEVNQIDPISVEELHVNEVRNIDPLNIEKFNVTNLPLLNMSLRQLPSVDLNIRRLPAVSIGSHQDFHMPSSYTVRARFLGIELFRIHLDGHTRIVPRERFRREQGRTQNRSFPVPETAGNPAIPSICREKDTQVSYPSSHSIPRLLHRTSAGKGVMVRQAPEGKAGRPGRDAVAVHLNKKEQRSSPISFGLPGMRFDIPQANPATTYGESCVSSGE